MIWIKKNKRKIIMGILALIILRLIFAIAIGEKCIGCY